jgi:TDG/mug DNA glycosylase family protein
VVTVLPDLVGHDPQVVFCGQAGAQSSRPREHYYEAPGNSFWESLHRSGFSPRLLRPEEDHLVVELGLGLTDLVGHDRRTRLEVDALVARVEEWQPEWLALTSKSVAHELARAFGRRPPGLGLADWYVAGAEVFVLPGTSGANRRRDYDGRPDRLAWWHELTQFCGRSGPH